MKINTVNALFFDGLIYQKINSHRDLNEKIYILLDIFLRILVKRKWKKTRK